MRAFLALLMMLVLSTALWAQGDGESPLCNQVVTGIDHACFNGNTNCSNDSGCNVQSFTAACTGDYLIDAWTFCGSSDCSKCAACVYVTKHSGTERLGNLTCTALGTDACQAEVCHRTCGPITLYAGQSYDLHVCLTYCPDNPNHCDGCACPASGCARHGQTAPCW